MKIAVLNFSGNVGKSTIAKHLFAARMPNAMHYAIETINVDEGGSDAILKGKQFGELQETLLPLDEAIVDVGSSNVEEFVRRMGQYQGSHEDYDLYVVPAVKSAKELRDTIRTIQLLLKMGVPGNKIRIVFNRVEHDDDVEDAFFPLYQFAADNKKVKLDAKAAIQYSDIFQRLRTMGLTIEQLVADDTDWKAELRAADSDDKKQTAVSMISMKRLAATAKTNLDMVFAAVAK